MEYISDPNERLKWSPSEIAVELFDICRHVEAEIVGRRDEAVNVWWAKKQAFRHALTLSSILTTSTPDPRRPIKILNLSGLSSGNQDFSICGFLRRRGFSYEYHALEHPNSSYLESSTFMELIEENNVRLFYGDLSKLSAASVSDACSEPDVILFTEIAEHLEHSVFLRSLGLMTPLLERGGRLIMTTPNADHLPRRWNHLFGRELGYWGDGNSNMKAGLFGHIVYYNIPRLRRLLADNSILITSARTFFHPYPKPYAAKLLRAANGVTLRAGNRLIDIAGRLWRFPGAMGALKTIGDTIYLEGRIGAKQEIPFEV